MAGERTIHAVSSLNVGGSERLVIDLASRQQRMGRRPVVLTLGERSDDLYAEALKQQIEVHVLRERGGEAGQLRSLMRLVRGAQPVALHIHSPWCLRKLAPVLPFVKGRIVYTRHGAHPYDSLYWRLLHKWAHRYVSHLTFVSAEALAVHRNTYHADHVPHQVLEFGVELPDGPVEPAANDEGSIRIGSVGRLATVKSQHHILDAITALRDPRAELHLYGGGPEHTRLQAQADRDLSGRVFFHGNIIDREQIYAGIDILVVASQMEGLSLAIMEAMVRGIPVIATDVGGNQRLIIDRRTGLLVPYGDVPAMTSALHTLIDDAPLRRSLATAAREHIRTHFSMARAAVTLDALYGFS